MEGAPSRALAAAHPEIAERLLACLAVLRLASQVEGLPGADSQTDAIFGSAAENCLGDFRILRMIGRGGMGIVYEAEQVSLKRRVALKMLPFVAALDPQQSGRFQIEAQAAALLHHTNIVPIFSVGCERGVHYYAMQFIEGQTLAALIHDLRQMAGLDATPPPESAAVSASLVEELVSGRLAPAPPRPGGERVAEGRVRGPRAGRWFPRASRRAPAAFPRPGGERVAEGNPPSSVLRTSSPPGEKGRVRGPRAGRWFCGNSRRPDGARLAERRVRGRSFGGSAYFRTAAHLALQAAEALDHAHRLGIIHRDIKPANLLVDVRGNLWITDFGLARMQADSSLTMTGDIVGTPRYTSPEQATPGRAIVDHRTDVYSLGATLYELLTLHPVHEGDDRAELLHNLAFAEPNPPRDWNRAIPRDLETIVLKALAKDVQGRYASALDLADDLRRFLEDRPIRARRPSLWKRAVKWGRRHKASVAAALLALTLVASGAMFTVQVRNNRQLSAKARHARYVEDIRRAFQFVSQGYQTEAIHVLSGHRPLADEDDERSFPWYYLWHRCHSQEGKTLRGHEGDVYHVEYSPNGKVLASCGEDHTIRLWDASSGQLMRALRGHEGDANYVTFSPDGSALATGGDDGAVRLWDAAAEGPSRILGKHSDWILCVLFTPDGRRVVSGGRGGILRSWDITTGQQQDFPSQSLHIEGMAISPDGRTLVTGGSNRYVTFWDLATAKIKSTLYVSSRVKSVAFSHDGQRIATAHADGYLKLWEIGSGQLWVILAGHADKARCVTFSPDDLTLASSGDDGTVRLWDVSADGFRTGRRRYIDRSDIRNPVGCVAFSPDGRTVASACQGGEINLRSLTPRRVPIAAESIRSMALSGDSRELTVFATKGSDGTIAVVDLTRGELSGERRIHQGSRIIGGTLSADGRELATSTLGEMVTLWDARTCQSRKSISVPGMGDGIEALGLERLKFALSPDGKILAVERPGQGILFWDTVDGAQRVSKQFNNARVTFLPNDRGVLVWHANGLTRWHVSTANYGPTSEGDKLIFGGSPRISPDGEMVAAGGQDGAIKLYRTSSLACDATLFGHGGQVQSLAWSPDGKILASSSVDRSVRLWDVATQQELGAIDDLAHYDYGLTFSAHGSVLAGVHSRDGCEVALWDAPRDASSHD